MTDWVKATDLEPLKTRKRLRVTVADHEIALFYVDGQVFAFRDICIHKQSSLSRGKVFRGKVICPGHQWAFDLNTGWNDQWSRCQPTFATKIEDGAVFVLPSPRVRESEPAADERYGEAEPAC